ncbi:MAG: radical SAM protein [Deltaproteobacteria bacterium]|nr:radical SAM protein [Deltaproteobacteria bacterium]
MRVLLLTPPMTQLNTPYPATAYLTGFLRSRGVDARQFDPAIELVSRLFSRSGLERVHARLKGKNKKQTADSVRFFLEAYDDYLRTVDLAVGFLQGRDPSLAVRLAARKLVPEGPRFVPLDEEHLAWAFGALGVNDRAKYVASLFVDDLADVVREGVDERFLLSRYGEKLAASAPTFDALERALGAEPSLVDELLAEITHDQLRLHEPDVVGLTVPFPGNVYGALRIAQQTRKLAPEAKIVLGGGYVNTELRELTDPRLFDYVDFVTLDDGERPMLCVLEHLEGKRPLAGLLRTYVREHGKVRLVSSPKEHDVPLKDTGTPTYDGLPLGKYLSVLELLNPMHRLWSDARWNKATLAHGCYWKKCSFCDVTLDYIGRYDPAGADLIIDRMAALAAETGQTGFHFVDEAAPPAVLKGVSTRLRERGLEFSWWGNIRFEKTFTPELAALMADAGCIAVSGGLEVASDRLLKLMNKGVTVEQVARVTRAFREAGIMVHAYLMYGFPTETVQETVDSLERVRQLFAADCIQSAYWHRFSATAHSPIGKEPGKFGIRLLEHPRVTFARNDLPFDDPTGVDHDALGVGLRKALYNYMHGIGLDADVRAWFDFKVPRADVRSDLVARALKTPAPRAGGRGRR